MKDPLGMAVSNKRGIIAGRHANGVVSESQM